MKSKTIAQCLICYVDYRANNFRRGVVRTRLLAKSIVIGLKKIFVEVKPSIWIALTNSGPIDRIEYASKCS